MRVPVDRVSSIATPKAALADHRRHPAVPKLVDKGLEISNEVSTCFSGSHGAGWQIKTCIGLALRLGLGGLGSWKKSGFARVADVVRTPDLHQDGRIDKRERPWSVG